MKLNWMCCAIRAWIFSTLFDLEEVASRVTMYFHKFLQIFSILQSVLIQITHLEVTINEVHTLKVVQNVLFSGSRTGLDLISFVKTLTGETEPF